MSNSPISQISQSKLALVLRKFAAAVEQLAGELDTAVSVVHYVKEFGGWAAADGTAFRSAIYDPAFGGWIPVADSRLKGQYDAQLGHLVQNQEDSDSPDPVTLELLDLRKRAREVIQAKAKAEAMALVRQAASETDRAYLESLGVDLPLDERRR